MPWLALVLLTVAVALTVVEAAVPGLGVAGVGATVTAIGATVVVWRVDVSPLPLGGVAAAAALWTAMLAWPRPAVWAQGAAAGLHAAGGIAYGLLAEDPPSVGVALVGSVALAVAFPPLHRWTRALAERQPSTGMEALVGRTAVVEEVTGGRLVVRLDGVLWSIAPIAPIAPVAPVAPGGPVAPVGPVALAAGVPVVVRGWRGVVLSVEPVGPGPGVPSAPA